MEKRKHFEQVLMVKLDVSMKKNTNKYISITLHKTQKSKWIKNLNRKSHTLNLIKQIMEDILKCVAIGENILNITPIGQTVRSTIDEWEIMILENFCKTKDIINRKRHCKDWENYSHTLHLDSGLLSKIPHETEKFL